ncbi:hypothetical protein ABVT39_024582 [Epinephelus coioides]
MQQKPSTFCKHAERSFVVYAYGVQGSVTQYADEQFRAYILRKYRKGGATTLLLRSAGTRRCRRGGSSYSIDVIPGSTQELFLIRAAVNYRAKNGKEDTWCILR